MAKISEKKKGNFNEFHQKSSQRSQRTFFASQRGQRSQRKKPPMDRDKTFINIPVITPVASSDPSNKNYKITKHGSSPTNNIIQVTREDPKFLEKGSYHATNSDQTPYIMTSWPINVDMKIKKVSRPPKVRKIPN